MPQLLPDAVRASPSTDAPRIVVVVEVIGPSAIPMLEREDIARAPVLAMLSTSAHMQHPDVARQALWTLDALTALPGDADGQLADILETALPSDVRDRMEELMQTGKYEYQSELAKKSFATGLERGVEQGREQGREEGREEGRALGKAESLLQVLRLRDVRVPQSAATRIAAEHDAARLDLWIERALTATSIDDVLADDGSHRPDLTAPRSV